MKRTLLIGLVITALILAAFFAIPAFAHVPDNGSSKPDGEQGWWAAMHEACEDSDWAAMHEACEDSDWAAMHEAAGETQGEDFDSMPCYREGYNNRTNRWGGHMGKGMMGG